MPEYAGWVEPKKQNVDWVLAGKELTSAVDAVETARSNRREANLKLLKDGENIIDSMEVPKTKTVADVAAQGANSGRNYMLEQHKLLKERKISASEYKERVNNTTASMTSFANTIKNYDQRIIAGMERQKPGEDGTPAPASSFEMWMNGEYAKQKNLNGKGLYIDPSSGRMLFGDMNPDGTPVDFSNMQDIKTMENVENMVDNRTNVSATVDGLVEGLGGWKTFEELSRGATSTVEDDRLNPEYQRFKANATAVLVSEDNPRGVLGVLLDNSNLPYKMYRTSTEKASLMADAIKIEEKVLGRPMTEEEKDKFLGDNNKYLVKITKDGNGIDQPVVTEEMIKDAEEVVGNYIESKIGREESGTAKRAPILRSGGGSGGDDDTPRFDTYEALFNAFELSGSNPAEAEELLNSLTPGRFSFEFGKKGLNVYALKWNEKEQDYVKTRVITGAKSGEQVAPVIWGNSATVGVDKSIESYNTEKSLFWQYRKQNNSTPSNKPPKKFN